MSRERYSYHSAHTSARPSLHRAIVALLLVTAVTLLVLAKSQHPALTHLRLKMLGSMKPVMSVVSQPVGASRALVSNTGKILNTAEENRQLRAENETLRHWQAVANALKAENDNLRSLMGYRPVEQVRYVTARVVGMSPGTFGQSLVLNAGAEQQVALLQPVVDAYGLVGRVVEVSPSASRVMLLSDVGSRIPVITNQGRQRAVLAGTGGEMLRLTFLETDAPLDLGDSVVTTQEGDLIPGGIVVGQVFKKDDTGYLVKPVRSLAQSEYVRVITR